MLRIVSSCPCYSCAVPIRVAAIGVSHWHSLYDSAYLRHLAAMPDMRLVALQDSSAEIAAQRAAAASTYTISPPPGAPPPALNANAQAAIDAAYSMIGVPYQFAGSSPESGFDCSGLTMWAWAHAGVSLPHSSEMQYAVLPHVAQSDLQPGDLVFFYSPIHHVGIYVGGGQMIDAPQTGTVVQMRSVEWNVYVGAARP